MADQRFMPDFDEEARELDAVVRRALRDAGGFDLVMRAESEPEVRTREIEPLLDSLGLLELVPDAGEQELQAAAAACRSAGAFALPYPLAERVAGNMVAAHGTAGAALAVVDDRRAGRGGRFRVNMGDLPLDWWLAGTSGSLAPARADAASGPRRGGRLGPFVADLIPGEPVPGSPVTLALALHLQIFTLLGMLESALELTVTHARERVQFGAPIIENQAVQHRLADAVTAMQMFEQQALYALWSADRRRAGLLADVAAARVAGLRAAEVVLRAGHQFHGATGFCDEVAISWISRHSQPLRRLPLNRPDTERWFTDLVLADGFDGLFPSTVPSLRKETSPRSGRAGR
ncbi:acyl-CoA dehydrogenase [Actinomadura sp. NBRC 104412]|uniref:acyl-CoA dehydrogenase family protein n=1 Tax=Actinomadura sp. NBRC 104412 TaxID=3032203 RepID=UPI0024A5C942|nr:acyl-CoA dehydrogenase family protein [Actinomadura sp. NBRC 104412]GLZ06177.1 acyl-CoA dehydrogenase [Actinomadura sp. NBRC 104412]